MRTANSIARVLLPGTTALCLLAGFSAMGQCPNNNTAIPGGAITPPCPGTMTIPCVTGGQYALLNVTSGNIYEFNTCNATYDTRITLYNNAGGGSIGYNDDDCGVQSRVIWNANFTGQLRVLVDRYINIFNTCMTGPCAPISITCYSPPPAVTNNECAGAIPLFVAPGCFIQSYSNVGATNSVAPPNPSCGYAATARDVWFRFTAPASGVVVIRTTAFSLTDAAMQLYSGVCGAMALIECDDDDGPGLMPMIDRRCSPLNPNQTYYLRLWGYNGSTGTFGICVDGPDFFPTPQQDCSGGFTVCNSGGVNNSSDYTGCTQDLNTGNRDCLVSNERQGTWYFFSPQATGTIAFNLTPINNLGNPVAADYDFAIWGPYPTVTCPPPNQPIRCSYALPPSSGPWATGMASGNVDNSENASGNGFVAPITVGAAAVDQVYIMYLDNFSTNGQAFNLGWNLSSSNLLDCTLLPVELLDLQATVVSKGIDVEWTAQQASRTQSYQVEHSSNGTDFLPIGHVSAVHSEGPVTTYVHPHGSPTDGVNYYRIKLLGGEEESYSKVVSATYQRGDHMLLASPNPTTSTIRIRIPEGAWEGLAMDLTDMRGRIISSRSSGSVTAGTDLHMSLDGLDAGCYLLRLSDKHGSTLGTGRVIKE